MTFNPADSLPNVTQAIVYLTAAQVSSSVGGTYPAQWKHGASRDAQWDPALLQSMNTLYTLTNYGYRI